MKTNQLQKNTPTDWKHVKLGDLYTITSSKRVFQDEWTSEGVPFYRAREIVKLSENGFVEDDLYISRKMFEEYKTKYGVPQKNDLLITGVGTIGMVYRVVDNREFYFKDGNIIWFKSKGLASSAFIEQLYKSPVTKNKLLGSSPITTVATYTIDAAKKAVVYLPPLSEQDRIVSVLETWDKSIEKLAQKIKVKKQVKRSLMQELLTGKKRLPGFSDKWESVNLGKIASFKKGKGLPKSELDSEGKYEAIHYGELFTKYNEYIENVISRTNSNKNMFLSKKNDILMPTSDVTPRGLSTASYIDKDGVILGGDILVIRSSGSLNGLFFCYLVNLNKKDVIKLVSGSTVFHLYGSDMAKFELKLPPLKEQESIVKILVTADKEITELEKKLSIIKEQKRYLLNNLITGTIRTPETLSTKLTK